MPAPTGKGVYTLGPHRYPDGDPAGYAASLGCDFVVLLNGLGVQTHAQRGLDLGLRVYLYATPEAWHPSNWADTFSLQVERVQAQGLAGIVADVEDVPAWRGHEDEVHAVGEALASAAREQLSVGFTSFPSWPWTDVVAHYLQPAGGWGSPQLYGVLEPGSPAELQRRGAPWRQLFGGAAYVPSLAAWSRSASAQTDYLRAFSSERGGILWLSGNTPAPGSPLFEALRAWHPRGAAAAQASDLLTFATRRILRPYPWG